jgi:hypothetical protein
LENTRKAREKGELIRTHSLNKCSSAGDESIGKACADDELNVRSHFKLRGSAQPTNLERVRLSLAVATPKHRRRRAAARYAECASQSRK